ASSTKSSPTPRLYGAFAWSPGQTGCGKSIRAARPDVNGWKMATDASGPSRHLEGAPRMSARSFRHQPRLVWFALAATALLIACGSASKHKTSAVGPTVPESSKLSVTLSATDVAGLGTVLVNGDGRTMYLLNSEQGGKITCTDANGCTKVWPDTELPRGMTAGIAGNGVQAALLGTARGPSGAMYLTYGGWPLYTFSGDA